MSKWAATFVLFISYYGNWGSMCHIEFACKKAGVNCTGDWWPGFDYRMGLFGALFLFHSLRGYIADIDGWSWLLSSE